MSGALQILLALTLPLSVLLINLADSTERGEQRGMLIGISALLLLISVVFLLGQIVEGIVL